MKIEKAIEILQDHVNWCDPIKEVDSYDALKLGIEALKHVKAIRVFSQAENPPLLPGETKEHHEVRIDEATNTPGD